jgi:iron(III) transport system substrate-binding protein
VRGSLGNGVEGAGLRGNRGPRGSGVYSGPYAPGLPGDGWHAPCGYGGPATEPDLGSAPPHAPTMPSRTTATLPPAREPVRRRRTLAAALALPLRALPLRALPLRALPLRALPLRALLGGLAALAGCGGPEPDLVVYTSMNQVHSEPVIERFERETGLDVHVEFDTEANKTVGLARRLREEARSGVHRCDVFWNNEVANTVALAQEGLYQPYRSPAAAGIDPRWFGPEDHYTGFAGRGRVIIANTERIDPAQLRGLEDLFDPRFAGQAAFVRPLAGTTLTHLTALYTTYGDEVGRAFAERLREANRSGQVRLYPGNMVLARAVASGEVAFGFTDVNDFNVVRAEGHPVVQIVPDQGPDGMGLVLLPNTIGILAGSKNLAAARRFVDFMVSAENEAYLAEHNAQIPFHPGVARPEHVLDPSQWRLMPIDYEAVGAQLLRVLAEQQERFLD